MGDRVSIQFQKGGDKSVVLFSHWDGMKIVDEAKRYVNLLEKEIAARPIRERPMFPVHRKEPHTIMVDFICQYIAGGLRTSQSPRVTGNYYLGATDGDGDNSDNGHHIISLD